MSGLITTANKIINKKTVGHVGSATFEPIIICPLLER